VNIQGDEPLLTPGMVDRLVEELERDPKAQMATLRYPMKGVEGQEDPNVVKVVADADGWALYFSRSPIPHFRGARINPGTAARESGSAVWYKHLGLYGYRREALQQFVGWPPSALERAEGLEQLRALERGMRIKVLDSPHDTVGVDTPDDLKRVEEMLSRA
jgi:3-deoxy-manno-octulosonate cytidylyltransferase (CMP-KDO synthetase)